MAAYPDFTAEGGELDDILGYWLWVDENHKLHRENDLPAVISKDGERFYWYNHGVLHRLDRPAAVTSTFELYYVDDTCFSTGDNKEFREACKRFRIKYGLLEPAPL